LVFSEYRVLSTDYGEAEPAKLFYPPMDTTLTFWQSLPTRMDPMIFSLGSFHVQWYGVMYLVAFAVTYILAMRRIRTEAARFGMYDAEFIQNLLTWAFFGVLVGGRFGYVFFYNFEYYLSHPLEIIIPFRFGPEGMRFTGIAGMSYHGGLLGCMLACYWFVRRQRGKGHPLKADYWHLCDLFGPVVPLGYTFGRIANFINGELWGRATDASIGMHFPAAPAVPGMLLRHPSQLYEAFFEGIVLFLILWSLRRRPFARGSFAGFYLIGYGVFRFFIEYFREPDVQLGGSENLFWFGLFSQGQALCIAMIAIGAGFVWWRHRVARNAGIKNVE
jgi:phosphatidylglycerol:prolipoprotein diacylglycerol transferase